MNIVLAEWNTPHIIDAFLAVYFEKTKHVKPLQEIRFISEIEPKNWLSSVGAGRIYLRDSTEFEIGSCKIEQFVHHCGIRSLYYPRILFSGAWTEKTQILGKLWLRTIETFLSFCGYSMLLAADGPGFTHQYLELCGRNWQLLKPGQNKRMGHQINFWHKYLNKNDFISWEPHAQSTPTT